MIVKAGSTNVTTYFVLRKTADSTELTGAIISDIDLVYTRSGSDHAAKVDALALSSVSRAHSDSRGIEVDATATPGLYRIDWPDAAFAAGVRETILTTIYSTAFTEHLEVELSPAVDAIAISGDEAAADALETVLDGTGGAVLMAAQLKLSCNVANEGALDCRNVHATGAGQWNSGGYVGQDNYGGTQGQANAGGEHGQVNSGVLAGQLNNGSGGPGQHCTGTTQGQFNTGPEAIKNQGTGPTPKALTLIGAADRIDDILTDTSEMQGNQASWLTATGFSTHAASDIWDVTIRTLTTNIPTSDAIADAIWDELVSDHVTTSTTGKALSDIDIESITVANVVDGVWNELVSDHTTAGTFGSYMSDMTTLGVGATAKTYTVTDSGTSLPIADVDVWVTTDAAGANVIASGRTDADGEVTFYLDSGSTVYVWRQRSGYDFTNPDTETV